MSYFTTSLFQYLSFSQVAERLFSFVLLDMVSVQAQNFGCKTCAMRCSASNMRLRGMAMLSRR